MMVMRSSIAMPRGASVSSSEGGAEPAGFLARLGGGSSSDDAGEARLARGAPGAGAGGRVRGDGVRPWPPPLADGRGWRLGSLSSLLSEDSESEPLELSSLAELGSRLPPSDGCERRGGAAAGAGRAAAAGAVGSAAAARAGAAGAAGAAGGAAAGAADDGAGPSEAEPSSESSSSESSLPSSDDPEEESSMVAAPPATGAVEAEGGCGEGDRRGTR